VSNLRVSVLGARSFVGKHVLEVLKTAGANTIALSRQNSPTDTLGATWQTLGIRDADTLALANDVPAAPFWICVAPIWVLPNYFEWIQASQAKRVVVVSSTSRFTKVASGDSAESAVAAKLIEGEARVQAWAEKHGIEWVILRPTLIYGDGRDKNISEICRFISRFGFFPLLGKAQGLRQPIHAQDVASACVAALMAPAAKNHAYNISGKEILSYRQMVERVFGALGRRTRCIEIPLWAFRGAITLMRLLPRYQHWTTAMAQRMNQDLVFDHAEAVRDFAFNPREFAMSKKDLTDALDQPKHPKH
jgi:nucleoside-diphosphate-sugar epimerase